MHAKLFGVISVYGLLIALGILLAVILCQYESKRRSLPQDTGIDMALWAVPFGVIGARIYYVLFRLDVYLADPLSVFAFWQGGLAIYGGVIGGALGLYLLSRRSRLPFRTLLDVVAPVLILAQAIGRWGNFFNGEAYGAVIKNTALQFFPIAVFTDGAWHMATFFYESCWDLTGFAVLWRYRLRTSRPGNVFLMYLMFYGAGRAVIEGLRTDSLMLGSIRVSQLLSVVLCVAAAYLLTRKSKEKA